ncbi:MAG: hypothetical protein HRT70_08260 [Flavobacteriaceae bacterium]|nr:hypothetical protein [Flavobacteriaceae bacterium]NQY33710.1 hypothetical protein [Alteromonadaceae bacterium]
MLQYKSNDFLKKSLTLSLLILSLTACGGSDSEPDPYESLSGSWQKLSSGQLTNSYVYYDNSGNMTYFGYNTESNCFIKHLISTSLTVTSVNHIEGNNFVGVRDSGKVTSIDYTVSTDGNYLYQGGADSKEYLKSDFTLSDFTSYLCE